MECKATVYGSEKTFRNYVTTNSKKISHLYLFKDNVADVIYIITVCHSSIHWFKRYFYFEISLLAIWMANISYLIIFSKD